MAGPQIITLPALGSDTLRAFQFAETVSFISLETNSDNLLKNLIQIWLNDSLILVSDLHNLLLFNHQGKFVNKEKDRENTCMIMSFEVIRDTVYLSTTGKRMLIWYTLDGTFFDEIPFPEQPAFMSSTANNHLAWYHHALGA